MIEDNVVNERWSEFDFQIKLTEMKIDASGSIPITWCLSPKVLEYVKDEPKVWVLLASTSMTPSGRRTEWRSYVALKDMIAYITFLSPGKNKIVGRITKRKTSVKDWMRRTSGDWMPRTSGDWINDVFHYPTPGVDDKKEIESYTYPFCKGYWDYYEDIAPSGTLQVDIPKDCFAPEPPEWEKAWVNFFWINKAVDQCEYRKRRMLTYPWQIIPFLSLWLTRFAIAALPMTFGFYNANWKPIFSPINHDTNDIWDGSVIKNMFFIKAFAEGEKLGLIFPIMIWASAISLYFGNIFFPICIWGSLLLIVILIGTMLIFSTTFIGKIIDKLFCYLGAKIEIWYKAYQEKNAILQAEEYQELLCSKSMRIKSIKDLPPKKRTFKLAFHGLKSKVCRPYSR